MMARLPRLTFANVAAAAVIYAAPALAVVILITWVMALPWKVVCKVIR